MSQWLTKTAPVFAVAFAPDGDQADVGDVTVTVTPDNLAAIVTDDTTTKSGSGATTIYTWTLPIGNAQTPQVLTLEWKRTATGEILTTTEELVGRLLFTETELRNYGDSKLSDENVHTDTMLLDARQRVSDLFEEYCGRGFFPRYARAEWPGNSNQHAYALYPVDAQLRAGGPGHYRDLLEVLTATDFGTAQTVGDLTVMDRKIVHTTRAWTSYATRTTPLPIEVAYVYGLPSVPPDIKEAALALARYEVASRDITDRMISFADPNIGQIRLSTPGPDRPTGLPLVDSTLNRWRGPTV
jgi:hypothetical protein